MNLYVLYAQRKQRYEGEYGFDALCCMSEPEQQANPGMLQAILEENLSTGEFAALAIVKLEVSGSDIWQALYPASKAIQAKVINEDLL